MSNMVGRPPLEKENKRDAILKVRLTLKEREKLELEAERLCLSKSTIVRRALFNWLNNERGATI